MIAQLEFELTYYDVAVLCVIHYVMGTPTCIGMIHMYVEVSISVWVCIGIGNIYIYIYIYIYVCVCVCVCVFSCVKRIAKQIREVSRF